jgi:predicted ribosomally synthesized peptide with nif11-like leader
LSKAAAYEFLARTSSDSEFFLGIACIDDPEERLAVIHAEGFDCTLEELSEAFAHPYRQESDQ